jgi:hypothetical protein
MVAQPRTCESYLRLLPVFRGRPLPQWPSYIADCVPVCSRCKPIAVARQMEEGRSTKTVQQELSHFTVAQTAAMVIKRRPRCIAHCWLATGTGHERENCSHKSWE